MPTFRVLVFGSTGSGKTSLCNALSPHKMPATDSVKGVTFQSYEYPEFLINDHRFLFTDTVGLNESDKGTVKSSESIEQLVTLIKHSKQGYNLLVHVMSKGRITKDHADNDDFFVRTLTQERIPCLLVVTRCEDCESMSAWMDANGSEFINQGFLYKDLLATCFAAGGPLEVHFAALRLESSAAVVKSIAKHAAPAPILIYDKEEGFF